MHATPPDRLSHRGLIILSARGCLRLISRQATRWLRDLPAALIILGSAVGDAPSLITVEGRRLLVSVIDHTATGGRCLLLEECRAVQLSPCEIEILHWVDLGKSNEQIAQIRRVKLSTVKKHLEHIFEKLGVDNRTAAASFLRELPGRTEN